MGPFIIIERYGALLYGAKLGMVATFVIMERYYGALPYGALRNNRKIWSSSIWDQAGDWWLPS